MAKKQKIERRAFSQLRVAEYLRFETLQKMTGRSFRDFPRVVVKELLDNALDAVETAGSAPQIEVVIDQDARARCFRLRVVDNGDGLSPDMVARTLDFETLTSDKALYRTPSRGQQGNALKSIIAMPYALGNKNPLVTITARGLQHQIRLRLGAGDEIIPGHKTESVENAEGTDITVWLPKVRVASSKESAFTGFGIHRDVGRLLRGYHLFNPHAKVSFSTSGLVRNHGESDEPQSAETTETHLPSDPSYQKFLPSDPLVVHWFDGPAFTRLIRNYVSHGDDMHLGEFLAKFRGFSAKPRRAPRGRGCPVRANSPASPTRTSAACSTRCARWSRSLPTTCSAHQSVRSTSWAPCGVSAGMAAALGTSSSRPSLTAPRR